MLDRGGEKLMKTVLITGKTYDVREQLKALGGQWDPAVKGWRVPEENAADARALVGEQRETLPFGELWQECFCGTEPVCVSCERCARHCGCRRGVPGAAVANYLPGEPYGGPDE
jgi:hypothetical protein